MSINNDKFGELLSTLDDLSNHQTFQVMLHLRELGKGDIDVVQEAVASVNCLEEGEVITFLKQLKAQFNSEDWATLLEII